MMLSGLCLCPSTSLRLHGGCHHFPQCCCSSVLAAVLPSTSVPFLSILYLSPEPTLQNAHRLVCVTHYPEIHQWLPLTLRMKSRVLTLAHVPLLAVLSHHTSSPTLSPVPWAQPYWPLGSWGHSQPPVAPGPSPASCSSVFVCLPLLIPAQMALPQEAFPDSFRLGQPPTPPPVLSRPVVLVSISFLATTVALPAAGLRWVLPNVC